jgi:hypothetical protein
MASLWHYYLLRYLFRRIRWIALMRIVLGISYIEQGDNAGAEMLFCCLQCRVVE